MTKVLLIAQEKGGVGKSLIARGFAEVSFEVQDPATSDQVREAIRRLVELGPRVKK